MKNLNDTEDKGVAVENRSFIRGLNVLVAVNEHNPATVSQVVAATGLAKATAIRLLYTLRSQGYIAFDQDAGGYKPLPKVRLLASSMMMSNTFGIAIRQYLNDFSQQVKWPSDFLMPEGNAMVLQATNRNVAPIGLKRFEQTRFPMLSSASGMAYLASIAKGLRQELVMTISTAEDGNKAAATARLIEQRILDTQERGYGTAYYNTPLDGMCAIGVPVLVHEKTIGALTLLVLHDAVTPDQLDGTLLPKLRAAASEIGRLYVQHGGTSPVGILDNGTESASG
ncbi:helix-turn-helix domain-containing protein [Pseudomonas akapageensis]|uniref:helix-turn-helix domain-containing protein n=1 Tax=Pseudomonas akapageensis TaxID=2609961 RepID=UPI00140B6F6D